MVDKRLLGGGLTLGAFIGIMATILTTTPSNQIFYCKSIDIVHYCERLSSTNKTCYWTENDNKYSKLCGSSLQWRPIKEFSNLTSKNIVLNIITDEQVILDTKTCFICDLELKKQLSSNIFPNSSTNDIENMIIEKKVKKLGNGLINVEYIFNTDLDDKGTRNINIIGYEEKILKSPVIT